MWPNPARSRTDRLLFPFGGATLLPQLDLHLLPDPSPDAETAPPATQTPSGAMNGGVGQRAPQGRKTARPVDTGQVAPVGQVKPPLPLSPMSPLSPVARVLRTKPEAYDMWERQTRLFQTDHGLDLDAARYQALRSVIAHYDTAP